MKRSLTMSAGVILTLAGLSVSTGASAALIHQYTFDSGSVAIDSIGSANGALFGGAAITGGELSLNGTDAYVETLGNHIVPTSGDFTVSMFAKETAFGGTYAELISQQGGNFYLGYDPSHNFRVTDAHLSTGIPFPTDGNYHNYALTLSGSTASLYIDGSLMGTFSGLALGTGGSDTRFGRQFDGHAEYFNGFIDDVRVYNTALSAAEIAAIANPTSPIPEPETYAMMLAGLGLLGFMARRRKLKEAA